MGDKTGISWTEATWNPIRGCLRVSDGCRHCYAEIVAARFSGPGQPYEGLARYVTRPNGDREARWTGKAMFIEKHLDGPLRKKRATIYFVNSMSDLFFEKFETAQIDRIVAVMGLAQHHTFQVLTKRPERMHEYLTDPLLPGRLIDAARKLKPSSLWNGSMYQLEYYMEDERPLPHVWWGVSVEDQATADQRIPILLDMPAAIRFASYEPAIGPIDWRAIPVADAHAKRPGPNIPVAELTPQMWIDIVEGRDLTSRVVCSVVGGAAESKLGFESLDWIIVGGESHADKAKAEAFNTAWAYQTIEQCTGTGTAVYVKQLGSRPVDNGWPIDLKGKADDPALWPAGLAVQQYPKGFTR